MKEALQKVLPANARLILYVVCAVALLAFGSWQASDGRWEVFTGSFLGALVNLLAAGNVTDVKPANQ